MKKLSKIIVALLSLSLIVGVVASTALFGYAEESYDRLNITDDPYNRYNDYSSTKTDTTGNFGATLVNDGDQTVGTVTTYSSGYYKITTNGGKTRYTGSALQSWTLSHNAGIAADNWKSNFFETSYAVLDFELATDRYAFSYTADVQRSYVVTGSGATTSEETLTGATLYQMVASVEEFEAYLNDPSSLEGKKVYTNKKGSTYTCTTTDVVSNVVIDADSLTLAYGNGNGSIGIAGSFIYATAATMATSGGKASRADLINLNGYAVRDPETGNWYMSDKSGAYSPDNNNILLSNKLGVFDHITVVFDNQISNEGGISYAIYVNGEYLSSDLLKNGSKFNNIGYLSPRGMGIYMSGAQKITTNFSLMMDNLAFNWYREDVVLGANKVDSYSPYVSGDDVYGVDDLVADRIAGVYNRVYDCADVLYTDEYVSPNGTLTVDGVSANLPAKATELLKSVKNGSVIKTDLSINNFDVPDGVDSFTVEYDKTKADFTLSAEDRNNYIIVDNGGGVYTVRKALDSDKVTLDYVIKYAGKEISVKLSKLLFGYAPESNITFSAFDLDTLALYEGSCTKWEFDIDGDFPSVNLLDVEAIRALSFTEASLVQEEFGGVLAAYGKCDENSVTKTDFSTYAYVLGYIDELGMFHLVKDSEGGYEKYKSIATLESEMASHGENTVCYRIEQGETPSAKPVSDLSEIEKLALWHGYDISGIVSSLNYDPALNNASANANAAESVIKTR